jgi:hypothetical protein
LGGGGLGLLDEGRKADRSTVGRNLQIGLAALALTAGVALLGALDNSLWSDDTHLFVRQGETWLRKGGVSGAVPLVNRLAVVRGEIWHTGVANPAMAGEGPLPGFHHRTGITCFESCGVYAVGDSIWVKGGRWRIHR